MTGPSWQPTPVGRWVELNLVDPDPDGAAPKGFLPDLLLWALAAPGAVEPVEGIVDGVRIELTALAAVIGEKAVADMLRLLERRLGAAMQLLRWADNREQLPVDRPPVPVAER